MGEKLMRCPESETCKRGCVHKGDFHGRTFQCLITCCYASGPCQPVENEADNGEG
jgi:hypothetical protein